MRSRLPKILKINSGGSVVIEAGMIAFEVWWVRSWWVRSGWVGMGGVDLM
jgi:hypothetical protein